MDASETAENPAPLPKCARCGRELDPVDHYLVHSEDGEHTAGFCRSEHIVAWVLRGAQWQLERPWEVAEEDRGAHGRLRLERVRRDTVIERQFEDLEALRAWASGGGVWGES